MKKTRGKKKKIVSSKKAKKFYFFNNKVAPVAVISVIVVFLAIALLLVFNHPTGSTISGSTISGNDVSSIGSSLDNPAPDFVINLTSWLGIGTSWREIVIGLIVLLISFAILFDILTLTSIFSPWVSGILAGGLAIIAALTNIIRMATLWMATWFAGLGVLAGFIEIGVAIVLFVGLSFGSAPIARFAAKRHANKAVVKSIRKAGDVEGAVAALKGINTELNKR